MYKKCTVSTDLNADALATNCALLGGITRDAPVVLQDVVGGETLEEALVVGDDNELEVGLATALANDPD